MFDKLKKAFNPLLKNVEDIKEKIKSVADEIEVDVKFYCKDELEVYRSVHILFYLYKKEMISWNTVDEEIEKLTSGKKILNNDFFKNIASKCTKLYYDKRIAKMTCEEVENKIKELTRLVEEYSSNSKSEVDLTMPENVTANFKK